MNPPNSFRDPIPGKGRSGGDLAPDGRRPGPDLIERAASYNEIIRILIVSAAAVALIFVAGP
jgi:hypothetical protein